MALEFSPEDNTTRSLLGKALLRQKKLAEAEKEFRLILQNEPKNFDALDTLGLVLYKQKRYSEALQHLQAAAKIRPDDVMVHFHMGTTLSKHGRTDEARESLVRGLNLLNKLPPSATKNHQLSEYKTALAALPNKAGTTPSR